MLLCVCPRYCAFLSVLLSFELPVCLCHALHVCTQGDESKPKAVSGAPSGGAKVVKVSRVDVSDIVMLSIDCPLCLQFTVGFVLISVESFSKCDIV